MKKRWIAWLPSLVLLLVAMAIFLTRQADSQAPSNPGAVHNDEGALTVITGVRLIDGTGREALDEAVIVVENGKIVAVGALDPSPWLGRAGVIVVDGKGLTAIPGLISAHSHLGLVAGGVFGPTQFTRDNIVQSLALYQGYGVTAVMSLGMNQDLLFQIRDEQRAGNVDGADAFSAGKGIGIEGGAPPLRMPSTQLARVNTPEEARAAVRQMALEKVDMVKLWTDTFHGQVKRMPPEISEAILDESAKLNLRVAAHLFFLDDAKTLLEQGVDVIAHSIRDQAVDGEVITKLKQQKVAYIPTVTLDESLYIYAEQPGWMRHPAFLKVADPKLLTEWSSPAYAKQLANNPNTEKNKAGFMMAKRNLKALHDAGVLVGFGTDSGANPNRLPGWMEHRELQLYVEAGLTPMQALVCATRNSAEIIGELDKRGTLEVGKQADFILLKEDPLKDIQHTLSIHTVYHRGIPRTSAF